MRHSWSFISFCPDSCPIQVTPALLYGGAMSNCKASVDMAAHKWNQLCEAIHTTTLATLGKKTSKSSNWFEAKSSGITPVVVAEQNALAEYKQSQNDKSLQALRNARNKVLQTVRHCINDF